jgi:hypothetical protein
MKEALRNELGVHAVVDRSTFQAELDALRVREKAHTREGGAIAGPILWRYRQAVSRTGERRLGWPTALVGVSLRSVLRIQNIPRSSSKHLRSRCKPS